MEIITAENINQFITVIDGEQWKISEEYPKYLVSSYGRCYSLKRHKILTPVLCADKDMLQYLCYKLPKNKCFKWIRVHRLVAMTFIDNPYGKSIVHHKDGDNFNNRADNLVWCTHIEHMEYHRELREKKSKKAA